MRYEFKKIYADLVTADGTVVITYLTTVTLLGKVHNFGAVEIYHPDGKREVHQGQHVSFPSAPPEGRLDVTLQLDDGAYELHLEPVQAVWSPSAVADGRLTWNVRCVRASACAVLSCSGGRRTYRGTGYVDWTHITECTRRLGLLGVSWGRVHAVSASIVFNRIAFRSGATWQQTVVWPVEGPPQLSTLLEPTVDDNRLQLALPGAAPIALVPVRPLHQGTAFDRDRIPRAAHRFICWLLGGPTQESRWLMRVDEDAGWALHEEVAFRAVPLRSMFVPHETERAVLQLVAQKLGCDPDRLRPSSDLVHELGADSLQLVQIAAAFEERFRRRMTERELDAFNRPADLLALIREPVHA